MTEDISIKAQDTLEFISFNELKASMNITTDKHDSKLVDVTHAANRKLSLDLYPYLDNRDIKGTGIFVDATQAAEQYARYLWTSQQSQFKRAEIHLQTYEGVKKSIILALKAIRPARTRTVAISDDPREGRLRLPSQRDTFVLGDF